MRSLLILLLAQHFISCFSTTNNTVIIEKLSTKQGLSQNTINCIFQDSQGFMWFGTNDGLHRYDGYEFKVYRPDKGRKNALSSLPVISVCEDSGNCLWIAYADDYLDIYDLKTEITIPVTINGNNRPDIRKIYNLNGDIWLCGRSEIYKAEKTNDSIFFRTVKTPMPSTLVLYSLNYYKGDVLAITNIGTRKIIKDKESDNQFTLSDKPISANNRFLNAVFYSKEVPISGEKQLCFLDTINRIDKTINYRSRFLLNDSHNNLWITSNKELYLYAQDSIQSWIFKRIKSNIAGKEKFDLMGDYITQVYEDSDGNFWIGTQNSGVTKISNKTNVFMHFYFERGNIIKTVFVDSHDGLWLGMSNREVKYLPESSHYSSNSEFKTLNNGTLNRQKVFGLFELKNPDKSIVFISPYSKNYDHAFKLTTHIPVPIALPEPLCNIDGIICDMAEDDNTIWISTYYNGLYSYDKKTNSMNHFTMSNGLLSNTVRSLLVDSDKNIWIGTDKGLQRISADERKLSNPYFKTYIAQPDSQSALSHNYILPIIESSSKTIWVGTLGGGLNKFMGDSVGFKHIDTSTGLPNNVIKAILEDDDGFLWVSSNKGLSRIDTASLHVLNFDEEDGLQGAEFSEFAACKLSNGHLVFGGFNGINVFNPYEVVVDTTLPHLVFTDFYLFNKPVVPGENRQGRAILKNSINYCDTIELYHNENSFTVFFSGLHYSSSYKLKYKYKLEGLDKEWIETTSEYRRAKYTGLKPGNYRLIVMVANANEKWNHQSKIIYINILPPWWKTKKAVFLYLVILLAFIILLRRFYEKQNVLRQQLQMTRFEKEKIEELNAIKLKFFTNISHEFRTPLTLISNYIDRLTDIWESGDTKKIGSDLQIAKRNTNVLLRLMNQLMDFRKLEQGKMRLSISEQNIVVFLREIADNFTVLTQKKNIHYQINIPQEPIHIWFDPSAMEKIIYNLLGNAFKYTPEGKSIEVAIKDTPTQVMITIKDTGIGIKRERQEKIFDCFQHSDHISDPNHASTGIGLCLTKELVVLHGGALDLISEENKGTEFRLSLNKGTHHFNEEWVVYGDSGFTPKNKPKVIAPVQQEQTLSSHQTTANGQYKLLIIDDHVEIRELLSTGLNHSFTILEAENGEAGLHLCRKQMPDIIISDVMMPVMDGFQLCKTIKTDRDLCHIPVILLTVKSTDESYIEGFEVGADAYIPKPFNLRILQGQIHSILNSRKLFQSQLKANSIELSDHTQLSMHDKEFLMKLNDLVEKHLHEPTFTVQFIASACGFTPKTLIAKMRQLFGETPKIYIRNKRLERAAKLLETGNYNVAQVTFDVGYSDLNHFRVAFKDYFGVTPSNYINSIN